MRKLNIRLLIMRSSQSKLKWHDLDPSWHSTLTLSCDNSVYLRGDDGPELNEVKWPDYVRYAPKPGLGDLTGKTRVTIC